MSLILQFLGKLMQLVSLFVLKEKEYTWMNNSANFICYLFAVNTLDLVRH